MTSALHNPEFARLRTQTEETREEAWRSFYTDYFDYLYRLVTRYGVQNGEIEDLCQQVFIIAHRKIIAGEEIEFPKAWLRSIAVRVVSDRRRWRKVRQVKQWLLESNSKEQRPVPSTPEEDASATQLQDQIGATLRKLSPKLRDVLVLCDIEECSLSEAAESLQIPVNTVRSRRRLARESFQKYWIAQEGLRA